MEDMEFDKFIKPLETSLQGNLYTSIKYFHVYNSLVHHVLTPNLFYWNDIKF